MSHSQVVCGYKVTAVGNQSIANLAAALAVVPLDFTIPSLFGMLPTKDVTATVGQSATRTITLQFAPLIPAAATTTLVFGENGGPIEALTLSNGEGGNGDYAGIPVMSFAGGSPYPLDASSGLLKSATAAAQMSIQDAFILNPGSGYTGATKATLIGGGLDARGIPAVVSPMIVAGTIGGITVTNPGLGYSSFAQVLLTDVPGGGSGGVVVMGLTVQNLLLFAPGDYKTAPAVVFTPPFQASNPDSADQKSTIRGWMTRTLEEALRSQIIPLEPVIT